MSTDPFKCSECADERVSILWFLFAPLGVFLLGMRSALTPQSERFGSLYRIAISYGASCSLILNALMSRSDIFDRYRGAFNLPLAAADQTSGFVTGNIDCLLGQPADVGSWLLAANAVPLTLLVVSVAVACAWGYICAPDRSLVTLAVRPVLVFTNSFLPLMLMSFLRSWPCYHTQKTGDHQGLMMYQAATQCPAYASWQFSVGLLGSAFVLAVGPGLWCALLFMAKDWDETVCMERLGFLTGAYKAEKRWWEATVLLRKLCFAIIVVLCPQSYSSFAHLLAVLVVLGAALALHLAAQPYKEEHDVAWLLSLNTIEANELGVSFVCLGATLYVVQDTWAESETVVIAMALVAVLLLTAFGALLLCLLAYEGLGKMQKLKDTVFGQTKAQESSAEVQQSEDSGAGVALPARDSPAAPANS